MFSIKKISIFSFVSLFFATLIVPVTLAQESSGNGLQISPTRTELTVDPGKTKEFSISVKNVTSGNVLAKSLVSDFESDGLTGNPRIITDDRKTPYSISGMVKGLSDLELKPDESKQISLTVEVPADSAPGAYYGVVRYTATPNKPGASETQQISLTASIGHLVFITVPGDVVQQIKLEELKISSEDGSTGVFFKKPTKVALKVKNLGNGFSQPFGNVIVFNPSNKEIFKYDVNSSDPKGIVLPNSSRIFEHKIENVKGPGKYRAVASVAYGNGGEVVDYEVSFWYLPAWFVAVLALVLIAFVVGGWMLYKKVARGGTKKSKKA